jgi:lipopolysaccharide heptosyltransferase I
MDYKKILVLRLSAVGDVLRTLLAVKALKEYYPSSHITWIVEEPSKSLLESQPEIDEVIQFPRRRWMEGIKSPRKIWRTMGEAWRFILDIRRRRFDVVLDFHGILKSGVLSFLSGSPKRVGFDRRTSREGSFLFSNVRVKLPQQKMSRFKKSFVLLKAMGLEIKDFNYKLYIPPKDCEYVESFFNTWPVRFKRPLIAIHPGTSPKTLNKRWMPDRYARLADCLIRDLNATVIFTWGPGELEQVKRIQKEMEESSVLGPKTESLTQLGEIYRRCDLYVGGDTGPMLIASIMGIPTVVIFGGTDPVLYEPLGHHINVGKEVGCNPCREWSCSEVTCLKAISVDDVFKATKEILSVTP